MLTETLTTLAAAAALHAQVVSATVPATPNTVSAPTVTAIAQPAKTDNRRGVRIPGTFTVAADQDSLEGVQSLYVVRSGDGA
ncbi:MAG TPA: hypothetical protein VHS78_17330 [Candidatus Elarobacter sp.]|jgi:hypothetical protein|nr:hypothetical protein [Candidatus Elarobacter sp.]